jgi:hypothetical protein
MTWEQIIIAIAIFGVPIVAIQVGRWRATRRQERRLAEFRTFTMTKANTIASGHGNALNSIPIEFYGHKSVVYYRNVNPRPDPLPGKAPV